MTNLKDKSGVNVIGYLSGSLGLGVLARNIVTLFRRLEIPTGIHDLDCYADKEKDQVARAGSYFADPGQLPYNINLFIAPPPTLSWLISEKPELFANSDRLNVAYSAWELMVLPESWKRTLEAFDVVVSCSDFNHQVFNSQLSGVPVILGQSPIYLPEGITPNRERFNLPKDKVIFVFSFDPASDIGRKNPYGAIEAFRGAFESQSRALLEINVNNARVKGQLRPEVVALQQRCNGDGRIRIITDELSYSDALSLYASCDVFVSLHRSEGLGLALMEAMALGKPVIATGWSGNMSFMDHASACLVGYDLAPVSANATHQYYQREFLGEDTVWAEPHVGDASAWMKRLATDPELRSDIGRSAERRIDRYQREAEQGRFLKEIESIYRSREFLSGVAEARNQKLKTLRRTMVDSQSSIGERAVHKVRRLIDRHVSWRFKSQ